MNSSAAGTSWHTLYTTTFPSCLKPKRDTSIEGCRGLSFRVLIPARYASRRFPGKPLVDLKGKTMIERVYERASSSAATSVCVATDDARIESAVKAFGGEVVMTSPEHPSGTDRVHEAAVRLGYSEAEIIVNVQGDEPLIPACAINRVADAIVRHGVVMATLCERIQRVEDVFDPDTVKVVRDESNFAGYFSRAPVPWDRTAFSPMPEALPQTGRWYRHLGVYAYTMALLDSFVGWPPAMMETVERLEQLRALERGVNIRVDETPSPIPPGIDRPEDLARTLEYMDD